MAKRWARIWFSFEGTDDATEERRLFQLAQAARNLGLEMEAGMVQDDPPQREWEDIPAGGRIYDPQGDPDAQRNDSHNGA
jgi:hypothetical protein